MVRSKGVNPSEISTEEEANAALRVVIQTLARIKQIKAQKRLVDQAVKAVNDELDTAKVPEAPEQHTFVTPRGPKGMILPFEGSPLTSFSEQIEATKKATGSGKKNQGDTKTTKTVEETQPENKKKRKASAGDSDEVTKSSGMKGFSNSY